MDSKIIQSDFDKLAFLDTDTWNHNNHYHSFLLNHLPSPCSCALDIGCGSGSFSRLLSQQASNVIALDLSPAMIQLAKQRSSCLNIDYQVADVLTWDFPENHFDCIVSIATFHHLPLATILLKIHDALKANGILLVLDLFAPEGFQDFLRGVIAVPTHTILKLKHSRHVRESKELREAWKAHGEHDTYLPVSEVETICREIIPGAIIKKHLLWRYSIVWKKVC